MFSFTPAVLLVFTADLTDRVCVSTLQVCVWQELQAVRTEISGLEEQKRHVSDAVKELVVSKAVHSHQFDFHSRFA